ncbi:MAG TPA: PfkB family carbohydrate kinase [Pseudonocardia sp.]|nr:PfkB family carbohydrate kinase [Pseudonocardia sp.]
MRESTVVCLGEALALVPALPEPGVEPDPATAQLAGAEANVAGGLAAAGVSAAWVSRLGAQLGTRGIEAGGVQRDPARPTGYYAKALDPDDPERSRMRYRRAGSAASAMDPGFLDIPAVADRLAAASLVHTSGITAALVEPVGAGDAFAAGLLTGLVRGEPVPRCLRRGQLSAAAVLTVHADSAAPPTGARGAALLDAPAQEWATIRVGPDGFSGPVAAGRRASCGGDG